MVTSMSESPLSREKLTSRCLAIGQDGTIPGHRSVPGRIRFSTFPLGLSPSIAWAFRLQISEQNGDYWRLQRTHTPPTGRALDSWMIVLRSMPVTCCCPDLHLVVTQLLGMWG